MNARFRFICLIASAMEYYLFWMDKGWDHFCIATACWVAALIEIMSAKPKYDEWERKNL